MPYENYINLKQSELDKPIYRIMPVNRLLECFENKQLVLVPPHKWDDPFENLLLSSQVTLSATGESGDISPIRDKVFGQCWTLHKETDAMWRIYSSDTNSAKVKTTTRKLFEALKASDNQFGDVTCFVGKVDYQTQRDLVATLKNIDLFQNNGSGIAKSLLYKRKEFKHEKEVRLIYTEGKGSIYSFDIDPEKLFDEVIFDPRMDNHLYKAFKAAIIAKNYTGRIDQSVLYKPPKNLVINV